jgi:hypothetical protein
VPRLFDALTSAELAELQARLETAEQKSLNAAVTTASAEETWPLIRVMVDLRCLSGDVLLAAPCAVAGEDAGR